MVADVVVVAFVIEWKIYSTLQIMEVLYFKTLVVRRAARSWGSPP